MSEEEQPIEHETPVSQIYVPFRLGLHILLEQWWEHERATNIPTEDKALLILAKLYRETRNAATDLPKTWPDGKEPEEFLDKNFALMQMMAELAPRT